MSDDCPTLKKEFVFTWIIENYSKKGFFCSPTFVAEILDETKWYLTFSKHRTTCWGKVTINRGCDDHPRTKVLSTTISCLSGNGEYAIQHRSDRCEFSRVSTQSFALEEIEPNKKNNFILNDALTLRCHLTQNEAELSQIGECHAWTRVAVTRIQKVWTVDMSIDFYRRRRQTILLRCGDNKQNSCVKLTGFVAKSSKYFHIDMEANARFKIVGKITVLKDGDQPCELNLAYNFNHTLDKFVFPYPYPNFIPANQIKSRQMSLLCDFTIFDDKDFNRVEYVNYVQPVYRNLSERNSSTRFTETVNGTEGASRIRCDEGSETSEIENRNFKFEDLELSLEDENGTSKSNLTSKVVESSKKRCCLREDILKLYKEKRFCDLTLRAGGETFLVHRTVLCARSQRFRELLSNNLVENGRGLVTGKQMLDSNDIRNSIVSGSEYRFNVMDVTDVDPFTLKLLVDYMYSDCLDDMQTENALKLYFAAVKYDFLSLKEECLSLLKPPHVLSLSTSNICEVLASTEGVEGDEILAKVEEFFFSKAEEILSMDAWKMVMQEKPHLSAQMMYKLWLRSKQSHSISSF